MPTNPLCWCSAYRVEGPATCTRIQTFSLCSALKPLHMMVQETSEEWDHHVLGVFQS